MGSSTPDSKGDASAFTKSMDDVKQRVLEEVQQAVMDVAADLGKEGAKRAPIKTGVLHASTSADPGFQLRPGSSGGQVVSATVSSRTVYAHYQHQ